VKNKLKEQEKFEQVKSRNSSYPITANQRCYDPENNNKISRLIIIILFLALLADFLLPPGLRAQTIILTDDLGHRLELLRCPERIISLAPNLTEILFALGLNKEIVGVTRFCDYPEEARTKDIIGGLVDPSLEKIQALHPELILGFRGNPRRVIEKLQGLRLPVFVFESGKSFDDLFLLIKRIGQLTCRQARAEQLIWEMKNRLQAIDSQLSEIKAPKKVFLHLYGQGTGLWTCGRDSYLHHLLLRAKLKNIASSVRGNWLVYNREKLVEDNPEIFLILCQNQESFQKARDWFLSQPALTRIKAVRTQNFIFLDENLFSRFGPRLIEAYEQLAKAVHPELFPEER